jgi:L-fuconolactonase
MSRVDAHQHFWRLDRGDSGWLTPALGPIHRDFAPADLAPLLARSDVAATVLVQAAPTGPETAFLLDIARTTPFIAGVVGWIDFEAAAAGDEITALAREPKLVGLRPMIQDLADDEWMLRSTLAPAIEAMIAADLAFDALVKPRHLPILRRFARRWPALRIVVDHGAKPDIAGGAFEPWAGEMAALARETGVLCKLSGLVTEAAPGFAPSDLWPFIDALIDAFGPGRLMWGSDWPVVNLASDYGAWLDMACGALARRLRSADRDQVFAQTARAAYRLAS